MRASRLEADGRFLVETHADELGAGRWVTFGKTDGMAPADEGEALEIADAARIAFPDRDVRIILARSERLLVEEPTLRPKSPMREEAAR